jgi:VIT1/CCC1 family predicted Fe2+/Mn2+ transporter
MPGGALIETVKASFSQSVGDIVFGMEDGTVSIFGLVFGVAATAADSQAVLLAGAIGAAAAAVSMMAGTYLDVETSRGQARARLARQQAAIAQTPDVEAKRVDGWLQGAGFSEPDRSAFVTLLRRSPDAWARLEAQIALGGADQRDPLVQSLWMFASDLFAAAVPVIPFGFFALAQARTVSVVITVLLLILLGAGRAKVAGTDLLRTIGETVGIATAAAVAGVVIGKLLAR